MKRLIFLFLFLSTTVFGQYLDWLQTSQWSFGSAHPTGLYNPGSAQAGDFGSIGSGNDMLSEPGLVFRTSTDGQSKTYNWSILSSGTSVASGTCTTAPNPSGGVSNGSYRVVAAISSSYSSFVIGGVDFGYGPTLAVTIVVNGTRYDINGGSSPQAYDVSFDFTARNYLTTAQTFSLVRGNAPPFETVQTWTIDPNRIENYTFSQSGVADGTSYHLEPQPDFDGGNTFDNMFMMVSSTETSFSRAFSFGTAPSSVYVYVAFANYHTADVPVDVLVDGEVAGTLIAVLGSSSSPGRSAFDFSIDLSPHQALVFQSADRNVVSTLSSSDGKRVYTVTIDKPIDHTVSTTSDLDSDTLTVVDTNDTTGVSTVSTVKIPTFNTTPGSITNPGSSLQPPASTGTGTDTGLATGYLATIATNTATPKFADAGFQDAVSRAGGRFNGSLVDKISSSVTDSVNAASEVHDPVSIESTLSPGMFQRLNPLARSTPHDINWNYSILDPMWTIDFSGVSLLPDSVRRKLNANPMQYAPIRYAALAIRNIVLFLLVSAFLRKIVSRVAEVAFSSTSVSPPPHTPISVTAGGGFRGATVSLGADLGLLAAAGWRALFTVFVLAVPVLFFGFLSADISDFMDLYVSFSLQNSIEAGGSFNGFNYLQGAFTFLNYWLPVTFMIFSSTYYLVVISPIWAISLVKAWVLRLFPA